MDNISDLKVLFKRRMEKQTIILNESLIDLEFAYLVINVLDELTEDYELNALTPNLKIALDTAYNNLKKAINEGSNSNKVLDYFESSEYYREYFDTIHIYKTKILN